MRRKSYCETSCLSSILCRPLCAPIHATQYVRTSSDRTAVDTCGRVYFLTKILQGFRNIAARYFNEDLRPSLSEGMATTACTAVFCAPISAVACSATCHFFSFLVVVHRSSIGHFDQDASFLHRLRFLPLHRSSMLHEWTLPADDANLVESGSPFALGRTYSDRK
ncbi:hypothetical protein EDD85DRAFT_243543 [Armillaria nabsnona]|nr:hypothetical protein EDD85DRAFT_243543 [Armillaria nabsnona]